MINGYMIYIKMTDKCQLSCKHCFNADNSSTEDLDVNGIVNLAQYCKYNKISIMGGEPLLADKKSIKQIIKAFSDKSNIISLTTNLMVDLDKDIDEIFDAVDEIRISFDPNIRFTSVQQLAKWYHNYKKISQKYRMKICLNMVLTSKLCALQPAKVFTFIKKLQCNKVNFQYLYLQGNSIKNKDLICPNHIANKWQYDFNDLAKNLITLASKNEIADTCFSSNYKQTKCSLTSFSINADNTISTCANSQKNTVFGSIKDIDLLIAKLNSNTRPLCEPNQKCLECKYFQVCIKACSKISWDDNDECPMLTKFLDNQLKVQSNEDTNTKQVPTTASTTKASTTTKNASSASNLQSKANTDAAKQK